MLNSKKLFVKDLEDPECHPTCARHVLIIIHDRDSHSFPVLRLSKRIGSSAFRSKIQAHQTTKNMEQAKPDDSVRKSSSGARQRSKPLAMG